MWTIVDLRAVAADPQVHAGEPRARVAERELAGELVDAGDRGRDREREHAGGAGRELGVVGGRQRVARPRRAQRDRRERARAAVLDAQPQQPARVYGEVLQGGRVDRELDPEAGSRDRRAACAAERGVVAQRGMAVRAGGSGHVYYLHDVRTARYVAWHRRARGSHGERNLHPVRHAK